MSARREDHRERAKEYRESAAKWLELSDSMLKFNRQWSRYALACAAEAHEKAQHEEQFFVVQR